MNTRLLFPIIACCLGWNTLTAQPGTGTAGQHEPVTVFRPVIPPVGLSKVSLPPISFYQSKGSWQHIIDSVWGPGLPINEKLQIFDEYAGTLQEKFDGFQSLGLNWDSLRTHYRSKIDSTTSRGRFAAIMNLFALSLRDVHTSAFDSIVVYSPLVPGLPLLVLSGIVSVEHFGAVLTALPDSSLLVLRTVPNHPLGLVPGDIVLGYEGVPWRHLCRELLAAELPVLGPGIGTRSSETHNRLISAGNNWHLFSSIDIVKHSTGDTVHLSVAPLTGLPSTPMFNNEQIPFPGIPIPDYGKGNNLSYGIIPGTQIGYIYLLSEYPNEATNTFFLQAITDLWNTEGLIIDMRWNTGGSALLDRAFQKLFSESRFTLEDAFRTSPSTYDLSPAGNAGDFKINGAPGSLYDRPIAVLLGPVCASMGDIVAQRFRYHPMVRFFGKSPVGSMGFNTIVGGHKDWFLHYSYSDMFHVGNPGTYLNRREFPIDEPVWFDPQDVANGDDTVVKHALQWMVSLAYAHDVTTDKIRVEKSGDSVLVKATVEHSLTRTLNVMALLGDFSGSPIDSTEMWNDGSHGDETAGDSVWSGFIRTPAEERMFAVTVLTNDASMGTSRRLMNAAVLSSAGPIEVEGYTFASTDTAAAPGKTLTYRISLINRGSIATVPNVTAKVRCSDSTVILQNVELTYGDLLPGQPEAGIATQRVRYSSRPGNYPVEFSVDISSNGLLIWTDTFVDMVVGVEETGQSVPATYALEQNFPNPFNPTTLIRYDIPGTGDQVSARSPVRLVVYDLLGREVSVLVNEEKAPGRYEVQFDASNLPSGIYLYRLAAGLFSRTNKMLLVK